MKPQEKLAYIVTGIGLAGITLMYWLAADPPSPWIFAITGGGELACIGIIIARKRAGHYD